MHGDSRITRRDLLGAGVGAGALVIAGCSEPDPDPDPDPDPEPTGDIDIHHLDVGQADATVLVTNNETIVIDTGDWPQEGQPVIDYLENLGIQHVDHLVATHAHADHIGGQAELIEHFETEHDGVGFVYDAGIQHTSQTYEDYLDAVDEYDKDLLIVEEGEALPVDEMEVFALNPPANDTRDGLHYNSVTLLFGDGGISYLTTGDAETDAESRMTSEWPDLLDVDIYQAGHHGSSTSSNDGFVDAVDPDLGVISSAYDSQFDHPHDETLLTFDEHSVETYWTGVHARTKVIVENGTVTTETDESFSTDPLDILEATPDTGSDERIPIPLEDSDAATLVVDRIEGGTAVLLSGSGGSVDSQAVVPAGRLPAAAGEGTVLSVTVEDGAVRDISVDTEADEKRRQAISQRLERLSTPLSDVR
jgi:competence protein ComEC